MSRFPIPRPNSGDAAFHFNFAIFEYLNARNVPSIQDYWYKGYIEVHRKKHVIQITSEPNGSVKVTVDAKISEGNYRCHKVYEFNLVEPSALQDIYERVMSKENK